MLFIDAACPKPYSPDLLAREIMGGTEATVIRLLAAMPDAVVMQHNRTADDGAQPQYKALDWNALPQSGPIVVLRNWDAALYIRHLGWSGPLYLWLHDLASLQQSLAFPALAASGIELIAVSHWHLDHVLTAARSLFGKAMDMPKGRVIYNPLPSLTPGPAERDPNRLVFISSPHKGLVDVLRHFQALKARHPKLELRIANAGGVPIAGLDGVTALGNLTHQHAMAEVSEAWCMFYPNMTYPETFGIVYAEANALGTPVIAHDFGSAREVLGDERQVVDGYDPAQVIARFEAWREGGRPTVEARPEFALEEITRAWRDLSA